MKNYYLSFLFLFAFSLANAQELVKGGNMEDASAWNFYYRTDLPDVDGTYEYNYKSNTPLKGVGGCFRVTGYGQMGPVIWQAVKLVAGKTYSLKGAFKNAKFEGTVNVWAEVILSKEKPAGGEIVLGNPFYKYEVNTWQSPTAVNIDGTYQDNFVKAGNFTDGNIVIPETETTDWYLIVKAGSYNTPGDKSVTYDLLFDEISLMEVTPPAPTGAEVVTAGNMENASAWTVMKPEGKEAKSEVNFNSTVSVPKDGSGGALSVKLIDNGVAVIYQPITVVPGHSYKLDYAMKFDGGGDILKSCWFSIFVTPLKPAFKPGGGYEDFGTIAADLGTMTWAAPGNTLTSWDDWASNLFKDKATGHEPDGTPVIIEIPEDASEQFYVVMNLGMDQGGASNTLIFDNFTLTDVTSTPPPPPTGAEVVTAGNMENASAWTVMKPEGKEAKSEVNFNSTVSVPKDGSGGALSVKLIDNGVAVIYQPITVVPGHSYKLDYAMKFDGGGDILKSCWFSIFVTPLKPAFKPGGGYEDFGTIAADLGTMTWAAPGNTLTSWDDWASNLFKDKATGHEPDGTPVIIEIPEDASEQFYVVMNLGMDQGGASNTLIFDNFTLTDVTSTPPPPPTGAEVVTAGNMENASAWTVMKPEGKEAKSEVNFNSTVSVPKDGSGGALSVKLIDNGVAVIYQPITVVPGHSYKLDYAMKFDGGGDILKSCWFSIFVTPLKPAFKPGGGYEDFGTIAADLGTMTWAAPGNTLTSWDDWASNLFKDKATGHEPDGTPVIIEIPEDASEQFYVVMNLGMDQGGASNTLIFDNFTLTDMTTDVKDPIMSSTSIKVYPNPTNGIVNFSNTEANKVDVYSITGSLLKSYHILNISNIDLSEFKQGTYLLKFTSEKSVEIHKIIKN